MESYQTWLGDGPERAVLCMLGLFDRPADEKVLGALLKSPAIPGLTESLTDLRPIAWRTILAKLPEPAAASVQLERVTVFVKKSKTPRGRRSAQSWTSRYASSCS